MLKNLIFTTLFAAIPCISFAQTSDNDYPEVKYCRQTSDVHDRVWEDCLYAMGELVANQVKKATSPEDFTKYAANVSSKCRILRKGLETEAGGSFPAHVPEILGCNVRNWSLVRNEVLKETYKSQ